MTQTTLDSKAVAVLKGLALDAVAKANSGHPGGPMSSADMAYILFKEYLRFDPADPAWPDRDRFVLSGGHMSALLYGLLTYCGFLGLDDLKNFRQRGSRTPGHPEVHVTPGVEATTGPLGQGFSMACGMAAAESLLAAKLGADVVDHTTYVLAGDGDMQEGVVLSSAALAGHWGLGKLVVLYDSNKIQLAGPTDRADSTDYRQVFEGMCWQVLEIDGHDHDQIRQALDAAKAERERPTLIIGNTVMAKGSPNLEGSCKTHGAPFPDDELKATKCNLCLDPDEEFALPAEVVEHFQGRFPSLKAEAAAWRARLEAKKTADADFAGLWAKAFAPRPEQKFTAPQYDGSAKVATRKAFGNALNAMMEELPFLAGGSADLDPSNQTEKFRNTVGVFGKDNRAGRNFSFGVREFPMGAMLNGMCLHGGLIPFGATFLVFSDYERNAIRMSALQELPVLHVFTHDSFYVGEDGPTHQPIEHVSSLRLIPNHLVLRPADARETNVCMAIALEQDRRPVSLMLSRQSLPVLPAELGATIESGTRRGGYILKDAEDGCPDTVIIASGSEVHMALDAAAALTGRKVRVVSMPCMELFDAQPEAYRTSVLPDGDVLNVAVEAGRGGLWHKYVGRKGLVLSLDHFGASAPAGVLAKEYGFTAENLTRLVLEKIQSQA